MNFRSIFVVAMALVATTTVAGEPFKRTLLQRGDVNATQEAFMGSGELAPDAVIAPHTHFGIEMGVIQEGEVELIVEGESAKRLKAGDVFTVPAGKVHSARNVAAGTSRMLGIWVVDKGKPLATPAP